jgi:hypothetical protein
MSVETGFYQRSGITIVLETVLQEVEVSVKSE